MEDSLNAKLPHESVLLIGGNGFLGSALRRRFSGLGWELYNIGRSPVVESFEGEEYYSINKYSFKQLEVLFRSKRVSLIIDLAYTSVPNTSYDDPVKDFSDNLYNVIQHLELTKALGIKRYLYFSSGGTVYGDLGQQAATEDAPNFPLSPYGITKLACERYINMYHRIHGLPTIILRPSNIYGPGQIPFRGQGLIATALGLALQQQPMHIYGNGANVRDYLYINDFCDAVIQIIQYGQAGRIFNVGSGYGITINDIVKEMRELLTAEGQSLTEVRSDQRPFDVRYNVLDVSRIRQECDWVPQTPLHVGLQKTWAWIQAHAKKQIKY